VDRAGLAQNDIRLQEVLAGDDVCAGRGLTTLDRVVAASDFDRSLASNRKTGSRGETGR
jgi:hypothetical protein